MKKSLRNVYPKRVDITILIIVTLAILLFSYTQPFMEIDKLVFFQSKYSLLQSIQGMWNSGLHFFAIIIFLFSILFPVFKLIVMFILWNFSFSHEVRAMIFHVLSALGKWSMLDVFVVGIIAVLVESQSFLSASPRVGIYIFAVAIIFSLTISLMMGKLMEKAGLDK